MARRRSKANLKDSDRWVEYIGVLGPLEAWDRLGRPVPLTTGQRRVLILLLDADGQALRSELMCEALWPGEQPGVAGPRLHTYVHSLRKAFGHGDAPAVSLDGIDHGYRLRVDPARFDCRRFAELDRAASEALARRETALARLYAADALRLWRGEALGALGAEELARAYARHLEEMRTATTRLLAEIRLALGEHHQLIPSLRYQLDQDPLDERLRRFLMLALYRSGRMAEALEVYESYWQELRAHGLVPTPELRQTEVAILSHDPVAQAPTDVGDGRAAVQLAAVGTVMCGRWAPIQTEAWGVGDAELTLMVRRGGGEVLTAQPGSLVARFDDLKQALTAATTVQSALRAGGGTTGRFVVHDGAGPPLHGARILETADRLLDEARDGHILVFRNAVGSAGADAPTGTELRELGEHVPKGTGLTMRLFQLTPHEGSDATPLFQPMSRPLPRAAPELAVSIAGRDALVEEVALALARSRVVSLIGPGGCGKTTVARGVARSLAAEHRAGSHFVDLGWSDGPDAVAVAVAAALGFTPSPFLDIVDAIADHLGSDRVLLVLDGCEQVAAACRALVDRIVESCPGTSVLVTSHVPLGSAHEQTIVVPPLRVPLPTERLEAAIDGRGAVDVFLLHLGGRERTPADIEVIARICRLLDGHALAIVLAAGRAQHLELVRLEAELQRALRDGAMFDVLDEGGRLARTLEWTFSLLPERERDVLLRLSLFHGPFLVSDVDELVHDLALDAASVARSIDELAALSVIVAEPGQEEPRRYRLLQPVREFVASKLASAPELLRRLQESHAHLSVRLAEEIDAAFGRRDEAAYLGRLDSVADNLRSTLSWSISAGETELAQRLGGSMWRPWFTRGWLAEAWGFLEQVLALEAAPTVAGNRALGGSSYIAWWLGDLAYTRSSAELTVARGRDLGDSWAVSWGLLGEVAAGMFSSTGPPDVDLAAVAETFAAAGFPWEAGQALQLLAGAAWHRGDYGAAAEAFWRAVALSRAAGSRTFVESLQGHGLMLALQDRVREGLREVDQALELAEQRGDRVAVCHGRAYRAAIARYDDALEESARLYALALAEARRTAEPWIAQWGLCGVARARAASEPQLAARMLGRAQALSEQTGIRLAPRERDDYCAASQIVTGHLGTEASAAAMDWGRRASTEEVIDLGLTIAG